MKLLFLFFPLLFFSQQKITTQNIDNKLEKSNAFLFDGKTDEMIKLNHLILKDSRQINYPKGKSYACYNLALAYSMQYRYSKSNYYLNVMESEFKNLNEDDEGIAVNILYSMNYKGTKMYDEALKRLKRNLVLVNKIKSDSARRFNRIVTLVEMAKNYMEKKDYDSATYYSRLTVEEAKKSKKTDTGLNTSLKIAILTLVETKIKQNKIDSAEYYFKSAQSVPIALGNNEFRTFQLLGDINRVKNQNDSAIVNYQKAIILAKKVKNYKKLSELYNSISEVYRKTEETQQEKKYQLLHNTLDDSLKVIENENLKDTVNLLVTDKQKPLADKNNLLILIICIGVISFIIIGFFIKKRERKKNEIIDTKEQETKQLTQQLNIAFEEVVQLAKKNDPTFMTRFQEVYPSFFPKLLQIEPDLQNSELKFCALLFLNFSSKDIAEYTFIRARSAQTRKSRLRKRLNIPSEEDLYIWIKNINQN
ncbi:TPR_REGION domain-containing protein [Chryseobacterium sp. IT-36CA2]